MRGLADIERDIVAIGAHLAGELVAAGPVEPLDIECDIAVGERGEAKIAADVDARRHTGQSSAKVEPIDAQFAQRDTQRRQARITFARARGRFARRQTRDSDMRRRHAIDLGFAAKERERRPIEGDIVEREPGAVLVADLGMGEAQRARKAAAKTLKLDRPAAELRRELLDRRAAGVGIGENDDEQQPEQRQADDHAGNRCRYSRAALRQKAIRQKDWPSPI